MRKTRGAVNLCGFRTGRAAKGKRRNQYKSGGSHDGIVVASQARMEQSICPGAALRIANALVLLMIAALAVMHRAINRVAAGGQAGGGERFGKRGDTRHQQCRQGC